METPLAARYFAVFRTCVFACLFIGSFAFYLPRYFELLNGGLNSDWRLIGWVPFVVGAFVALRCAFGFAWTGRGTPAPFDPPRKLVVTGWYRYVRNPMYFGFAVLLVGEWLLWGSNLVGAVIYFLCYWAAVALFVVIYEEPTLKRKFAEDYAEYVRHVPRFVPRLRPWHPEKEKSATHVL